MHCLIGLLVLLASFILLIHYVINADSKRGLIRRLYAIGLSKKELNWILLTEYLNYILFALILSVPIMGMLATMAVTINSDRDGIGFTGCGSRAGLHLTYCSVRADRDSDLFCQQTVDQQNFVRALRLLKDGIRLCERKFYKWIST